MKKSILFTISILFVLTSYSAKPVHKTGVKSQIKQNVINWFKEYYVAENAINKLKIIKITITPRYEYDELSDSIENHTRYHLLRELIAITPRKIYGNFNIIRDSTHYKNKMEEVIQDSINLIKLKTKLNNCKPKTNILYYNVIVYCVKTIKTQTTYVPNCPHYYFFKFDHKNNYGYDEYKSIGD